MESLKKVRDADDKHQKFRRQKAYNYLGLFADILSGFLSWSMATELPASVFFYPMFDMKWTGYESFFAVYITVPLLGIKSWRRLASTQTWLFRLLSAISFFGFFAPEIKYRLIYLGAGTFFDLHGILGVWINTADKERRDRSVLGYLLGFIAFVTFRMGFCTLDPIWAINEYTVGAIVACVICAAIYFIEGGSDKTKMTATVTKEKTPNSILTGLAFGGLLFELHFFFTAHSVISRWTELPPFPHGAIVILAMCLGLLLSYSNVVNTFVWWFGAAIVGWFLLASSQGSFPHYIEFFGGLLLAVYVFSQWISLIDSLSNAKHPGFGLFLGMTFYFAAHIWGVYVVAYKFVPGGEILRERNISLAFVPLVLTAIGTIKRIFPSNAAPAYKLAPQVKTAIAIIMIVIFAPVTIYRSYRVTLQPSDPNPSEMRALAWAVHFGYNNVGYTNLPGLAQVMRESGANIIGMVETDCTRTVMANRDLVEWLGDELSFYSDFGPSTAQNTWGCALLSAWPIERSDRIVMPSPEGELACLIDADIRVNGSKVNILVAHFGNTEDELDLELQSKYLSDLVASRKDWNPMIFVGYITSDPFTFKYERLIQSGLRDSSNSLDRYCLYVLYKDVERINFERYDKGNVSDTEAQVGTFLLKEKPTSEYIATPDSCRKFHNDSVLCQSVKTCGWCQLSTIGECYEPQIKDQCKAVGGVYIGPEEVNGVTPVTENSKKEFINLQFEQQKKGLYPVINLASNKFQWTVNGFNDIDFFAGHWSSGVFEYQGTFWRVGMSLHRKRKSLNERSFEIDLENVSKNNAKPRVNISLVNQKSISQSKTFTFNGQSKYTFVTMEELHNNGFLVEDSVKILVHFD